MKSFIFVLLCSTVCALNDTNGANETETEVDGRKRYGLGFHGPCVEYVRVFKCMASCKSLGYQVYRLDFKCKCMCLDLQTTNVLPYFKWGTTGTPKTIPTTRSARVYDVVGTLSPFPHWPPTKTKTISSTCPTLPPWFNQTTASGSNVTTGDGNNTDVSGTEGGISIPPSGQSDSDANGTVASETGTAATGGDTTVAEAETVTKIAATTTTIPETVAA